MPVIGVNFEPALSWRKPAIDYVTHGKPALAEPESERLLFTTIAGVALHTNRHVLTISLKPVQAPDLLSCPIWRAQFVKGASRPFADGRRWCPIADDRRRTRPTPDLRQLAVSGLSV